MFLLQSDLIIIPTVPVWRIIKELDIGVILSNNELLFYEEQSSKKHFYE